MEVHGITWPRCPGQLGTCVTGGREAEVRATVRQDVEMLSWSQVLNAHAVTVQRCRTR